MFEDVYVTVTGLKFQAPIKKLRVGDFVYFLKDYDNDYDEEAIVAFVEDKGRVGYVANSTRTVAKGTFSAGRVYDRFTNVAFGIVAFITKDEAIVRMVHFQQSDDDLEKIDDKQLESFSITIRKY